MKAHNVIIDTKTKIFINKLLKNLLLFLFLGFLLLLSLIFYKSEIILSGSKFLYYLPYYLICLFGLIYTIFLYYSRLKIKIYNIFFGIILLIPFFMYEIFLEYSLINFENAARQGLLSRISLFRCFICFLGPCFSYLVKI